MKHICFISSFGRCGQPILYRQANSLVQHGFQVSILFNDNEPKETINGIKVYGSGIELRGYSGRLLKSPKHLYKRAIEIDADFYQTFDVENIITCLLLKRKGKKIIFDLLENHPYSFFEKSNKPPVINRLMIAPFVFLMKYGLRKFDLVYTVTDDIALYLKKWGIKNVKLFANYPIIDYNYVLSFEDYNARKDKIIYFGLIYNVSRQDIFLDALEQTPGVKYLLAGIFSSGNDNSYQSKVMNKPAWNRVEFINGFKKEDLPSLLAQCTISNVLRDFSSMKGCENGSMGIVKIFESMEAGLPIICSNVPVYQELMMKYPCGILVDPLNPQEIADAISFFIRNKKEAYLMGQEGRRAVLEEFNWDKEASKYILDLTKL